MKRCRFLLFVFCLSTFFSLRVFAGDVSENMADLLYRAEQGDTTAQNRLGFMYYNGDGVVRDTNEGFSWYEKAAKNGNSDSQIALCLIFKFGVGDLDADLKTAYAWAYAASKQGRNNAAEIAANIKSQLSVQEYETAELLAHKYYESYVVPFQKGD